MSDTIDHRSGEQTPPFGTPAAPHPPVVAPATAHAGPHRQPWPWLIAVAVLAVGVVVLAATTLYDNHSARQWRSRARADAAEAQDLAAQLGTAQAHERDLGNQVTLLSAQAQSLQSDLKSAQSNLDSSQRRLSSVANQKAKAQDLTAYAGKVAATLQSCIDATDQLIDAASTDPGNLDAQARNVGALCDAARSANADLQAAIAAAGG